MPKQSGMEAWCPCTLVCVRAPGSFLLFSYHITPDAFYDELSNACDEPAIHMCTNDYIREVKI